MILVNGKIVSTSDQIQSMSQAEYDALTDEKKNDGTTYFITDVDDSQYRKILNVGFTIGSESKLAELGYTDLVSAIVDFYERLGGISLRLDANQNIEFVYNSEEPTPATPVTIPENATDAEKIAHYETLIGDMSKLYELGFSNVVAALDTLYDKLSGMALSYNEESDTLKISYNSDTP